MLHGLCFGEEAGARNLVFFRVKWLQPAMKGTSSVRRLRLRSFLSRIVPPMCFAMSGCSCVRSSMRFLKLWLQIALEWLHECCMGYVCGEEAGARNLVFFRVKWLEATMKGTSSVRRLRLRSFRTRIGSSYVFCNESLLPVCVVLCVSCSSGCRSHWNGCMMLHGLCFGEEAGARNLVFFRVKWLQPAMKGTFVCATVAAAVVPDANWFLLCVLQRIFVPVCVVLCVS